MRNIALLLCATALVASCKAKSDSSQPPAVSADSTQKAAPSDGSTQAQKPVVENFDRVANAAIDHALDAYPAGDTLSKDSIWTDECAGATIYRTRLRNNLTLEGAGTPKNSKWTFDGKFRPLLGLEPGMTQAQVRNRLGRPESAFSDSMVYVSAKPEDSDSAIFDARWLIQLQFHQDSLKAISFQPSFDDC